MVYGKRIKEVRLLLKIKQKDLASGLGISQSYLCGIENGTKQPNGDTIIKLVNEFHVSALWLRDGIGPVFLNDDDLVFIKAAEVGENGLSYNFPLLKEYLDETLDVMTEKLIYYKVDSDNMEPTIKKDDIVLVDTSERSTDSEGIYLFEIDSKKVVRRLLLVPQKHLVNDNPSIKNNHIVFDSSIECVGKIVWFGRKI